MSYSGYLLKIGSTEIPLKYLKHNSYDINPNTRIDLDSFRDANGMLRREVLPHTVTSITFTTVPMDLIDMQTFVRILKDNFTVDIEKKCSLTYYDMENDTYKTGDFYVPDIKWSIYQATATNIRYNPVEISFIEY